jgi:dipeptidase E
MEPQIIAMGGGGFLMEPDHLALDRYILAQALKHRPRVCFLPTASGDSENMVFRFYDAFTKLDCQPAFCSLFKLPTADLEDYLLSQDILYVGGGNTRSMIALWKEWGLDRILRKCYETGVVLAGISAGANCWFEQCLTDSMPGQILSWPCLGFLPGSFCPHYDGETERRPAFHRLLAEGKVLPGIAADDGAAAHFRSGELWRLVSSRPNAKVYRLSCPHGQVVEETLDPQVLESHPPRTTSDR